MTVTEKDLQVNLENQGRIFDTLNDTSMLPPKNVKTSKPNTLVFVF